MSTKPVLTAILVAASMAALLNAGQPVPLPVFSVIAANGSTVQSSHLSPSSQWLILYIQADCQACETVLQLIKQAQQHPNLPHRLVIIGDMTLAQLTDLKQRYPDLSSAFWSIDTARSAFRALKLAGTPTVLGIKGPTIAWNLNGVLHDTQQFVQILESWTN